MRYLIAVIMVTFPIILICSVPYASVGGTYVIGRDDQGVYLVTDRGKSWYIDRKDRKFFKVGEKGTYTVGSDSKGTYLTAGKHRKFYVGKVSEAQMQREIDAYQKKQVASRKNRYETRVQVIGNQVLVPVTIWSGYRKIEAQLLLDTGASITVLHRDVADRLKLKPVKKGLAQVVGGGKIPMAVAVVKKMETGGVSKTNMYAGIIDYQGGAVPHQGLLGMDFLQGMKYKIDYQKQTIQWQR